MTPMTTPCWICWTRWGAGRCWSPIGRRGGQGFRCWRRSASSPRNNSSPRGRLPLLLVELCLQRIHSCLEVFLALLLLFVPYRLSGGLVSLPRGLFLRLQLGEHLVQRPPRYLATEPGRELLQRSGRDFVRHGQDRVAARRYQAPECGDRLITRVQAIRVIQGAARGADTPAQQHPDRATEHTDEHPDQAATGGSNTGGGVARLGHPQLPLSVPFDDRPRPDPVLVGSGGQLAERLVGRAGLWKRDCRCVLRHPLTPFVDSKPTRAVADRVPMWP